MEGIQFVEDVVPTLDARMSKDLATRDHLKGDAAEAKADPDVGVPWILALAGPACGQGLEVVVAEDQVIGDTEDGSAERAVAVAHQGPVGFVHFVTLITRWTETSAAGDRLGVGVVVDGSGLASEVGGTDDVDARDGEEQHVGRLHQPAGDLAFQGLNFLGFSLAIVVEGQSDASVLAGGTIAGSGPRGPVEDVLDSALLEADAGFAQRVT